MVIVSSNNRVVALRLLRILRSHFRWGQSWLRHRSVRFCVDSWFACIFDYRSGTVTGNSSLCSAGNSSPLPLILDLNLTSASMWRKLISLNARRLLTTRLKTDTSPLMGTCGGFSLSSRWRAVKTAWFKLRTFSAFRNPGRSANNKKTQIPRLLDNR